MFYHEFHHPAEERDRPLLADIALIHRSVDYVRRVELARIPVRGLGVEKPSEVDVAIPIAVRKRQGDNQVVGYLSIARIWLIFG